MTVNFPTSYDDQASLFGELDDFVVVTLDGSITYNTLSATFNELSMVDNLDVDTRLVFKDKGSSPITFTGVTDDITLGGTYVGHGKKTEYVVEIDGTGSPDTFKWSNDGGSTWVETGKDCVGSGSPYTLEEGLTVYWTSTTGHTLADKWEWDSGFEIINISGHGATGVLNILRSFNGSVAMAHADDAQATQDPVEYDFTILREALVAAQKFAGLVGVDASKTATPVPGEVYIATDTNKVYICFVANTWKTFNRSDHGDYANLGADDHTQYHNDSRKATWHTALTGDHLTTIAHDHRGSGTEGNPTKKFSTGLDANKGTPSVVGQVYYGYDQNNLYFSANGSSWTRYTAMPKGTVMFFNAACPTGWTVVTELDGKFVKQADAAEWTGLDAGGVDTHIHEMQDVVTHSHSVNAQAGITSTSKGSHNHNFNVRISAGSGTYSYEYTLVGETYSNTTGSGEHSHTITIAAYNSGGTGSNPANTDSASNLLAYYKLRACKKT